MSQRDSGYARKERDCYETPEWVTQALLPHFPREPAIIWEPAAGSGKIVGALRTAGFRVEASDIMEGREFLMESETSATAIVTNPPYGVADRFIEHATDLMRPDGFVAMLLRTDFDHAKTRQHLFGNSDIFAKKVVLTKRIRWIEGSTGQPSFNHAWFIWDWKREGAPTLAYGP